MELQKNVMSRPNQDPGNTPEEVLQSLVAPYKLPAYSNEIDNRELVSVFLKYIEIIVENLPGGCVDGIWEDILWKTLCYSKHLCPQDINQSIVYAENLDNLGIRDWLEKALCNFPRRCRNPYIRLSLFHLAWLCSVHLVYSDLVRNQLCITFLNTICEVQPLRLYPSYDMDDVVFSAKVMEYIFQELDTQNYIQHSVSGDLQRHINFHLRQGLDTDQWLNSILSPETDFVTQCLQIIGVFADIAKQNPDYETAYIELRHCCIIFKECLGRLIKCRNGMPYKSQWMQFVYIFTIPKFCPYVVDTIRELTDAIINHKSGFNQNHLMYLRNIITKDIHFCSNSFQLPKLLLSRQVQGPKHVKRYSLLITNRYFNSEMSSMDDSSSKCSDSLSDAILTRDGLSSCDSSSDTTDNSD